MEEDEKKKKEEEARKEGEVQIKKRQAEKAKSKPQNNEEEEGEESDSEGPLSSTELVFVKKKMMPTRHDNTISMERIMMVYCIIEHLLVNIGKTIREHIIAWVKHPRGARHFPNLIEKLCLNACPMLEQLPQVEVKDGV
ncbi:drebrin-like [Cucumis melo var. makuwa]|uniref:Drebrin-like n=1 Tax=Cucumis melo var. makuwa TaxID=1194695 RepID=A0A5A7UEH4_CUCMM|nr:drebrin-like [Cucumis melo var. makuwa]